MIPTLEAAGDRVRACLRAIAATTAEPHEVIVVDNGSSPQGYTRPVNAGVRAASGAAIVVMNDDVEPLPGGWPPLRAALAAGAEVVFPRTVEGATREDFAAWCFAFDRRAIDRFGVRPGEFLDTRFTVWFQDTDLLMRLRAAGSPPGARARVDDSPRALADGQHAGAGACGVDPRADHDRRRARRA